ncbi:limonene-1,2-epoxide hydrolase [Myxococcaceae bacterium]|jgi:ketosteroid isomerase-like protein|nr:limonene-1,2-epoxide hydrolase [Myxococcaceae bacterium]
MAARKKSPRKTSKSKPVRKAPAKKTASRPSRRKPATKPVMSPLEAVARRLVAATVDPSKFVIADLYTPDCVSQEAAGEAHHGHAGIEAKAKQWEQMQTGTKWKARNVFLGRNTICIEWDARVTLRDGRVVAMPEVAVHEIRNGKIARERFYYDPMALMPPSGS